MPKNVENINPLHEEVHEEEARIFKNDKSHNFVLIEQVLDKESFDPFDKDNENNSGNVDEESEVDPEDGWRDMEWEEKRRKQLSTEIKLHQREGVASLYTEKEGEYEDHNSSFDETEKEEAEFDIITEDAPIISKRKSNMPITSMSHQKSAGDYESRRSLKRDKDKNAGHDNLKTLVKKQPESKNRFPRIKKIRNAIRNFLTKQNYEETHKQEVEKQFENNFFAEDIAEPKLNGRPLDKRFYEDEDDMAA